MPGPPEVGGSVWFRTLGERCQRCATERRLAAKSWLPSMEQRHAAGNGARRDAGDEASLIGDVAARERQVGQGISVLCVVAGRYQHPRRTEALDAGAAISSRARRNPPSRSQKD
jgi:hypothetical protein